MTAYRLALGLIVVAFYGGIFLLRALGHDELYQSLLQGLGVDAFRFPFLDTHAILSAAQCYREGIDIYVSNPCDVLLRPLPYSPLWYDIIPAFITTAETPAVGIAFNLIFLASVLALLRPVSWGELILLALACTSTAVTYAVERGNVDLLLFGFAAVAIWLCGGGPTARLGAYAVGFLGGVLKFYPLVLLALALREAPRRLLLIAAAAALGLAVFVAYYNVAILYGLKSLPRGAYFIDAFSAKNLPFGTADLATGFGTYAKPLSYALFALLLVPFGAAVALVARRIWTERSLLDWDRIEIRSMVVGSILVVGCFFAGQNAGYRGVHLLLVLPGLMLLTRAVAEPGLRTLLRLTVGAILLVMWAWAIERLLERGFGAVGIEIATAERPNLIFWTLRELLWWWVVAVLASVVALFALASTVGRAIARALYPPSRAWSRP